MKANKESSPFLELASASHGERRVTNCDGEEAVRVRTQLHDSQRWRGSGRVRARVIGMWGYKTEREVRSAPP
jgi:hypothetical protein